MHLYKVPNLHIHTHCTCLYTGECLDNENVVLPSSLLDCCVNIVLDLLGRNGMKSYLDSCSSVPSHLLHIPSLQVVKGECIYKDVSPFREPPAHVNELYAELSKYNITRIPKDQIMSVANSVPSPSFLIPCY